MTAASFMAAVHPRPRALTRAVATATLLLTVALAAAACTSERPSVAPESIPANAIKVTASEYKFDPSTLTTKSGDVTFAVTNGGTTEHEFEIFQGDKVIDEIEGLTPGLTKPLTVTLAPGAYTYVCKLAGHDALGMKGDLTVTAS